VYENATHSIQYSGALHATTLVPYECESNETCGESKVFQTFFNVSVWLHANGTTSVLFFSTSVHFEAYWVRNVWLTGEDAGNLKVVLRTKVKHLDTTEETPHTTMLKNPMVVSEGETGYPIFFAGDTMPPCLNVDEYCIQEWCLRTYDAVDVIDFSGHKPIKFDLFVHGENRSEVSISLDLKVKHIGSQTHLTGKIDTGLTLYHDEWLQYPYDCENPERPSFYDCDTVYGVLRLLYQTHLKLTIYKAYICFSLTEDLPLYDPFNPDYTGCNAPGAGRIQIYNKDMTELYGQSEYAAHHFIVLNDEHSLGSYAVGFSFQVHAYTVYKQILQIHWYAEENGGEGGLIERIVEYSLGDRDSDVVSYAESEKYQMEFPRRQLKSVEIEEEEDGALTIEKQSKRQREQNSENFDDNSKQYDSDYYENKHQTSEKTYGEGYPTYGGGYTSHDSSYPVYSKPGTYYQKQDHSHDHTSFVVHCPKGYTWDSYYLKCTVGDVFDGFSAFFIAMVVLFCVLVLLYICFHLGLSLPYSTLCCCCFSYAHRSALANSRLHITTEHRSHLQHTTNKTTTNKTTTRKHVTKHKNSSSTEDEPFE
jgi:hypothetical protein